MMAEMVCSGESVESCSQGREGLGLEVTLNRVMVFIRGAGNAADSDGIT